MSKGSPASAKDWFERCASRDLGAGIPRNVVYGLDVPYRDYGDIALELTPGFWTSAGIAEYVIEIGVSGALHFFGKASKSEILYFGHQ